MCLHYFFTRFTFVFFLCCQNGLFTETIFSSIGNRKRKKKKKKKRKQKEGSKSIPILAESIKFSKNGKRKEEKNKIEGKFPF